MAVEVIMPKMEMAQDTGTVVRWLKAEGSPVQKGEPLLEIETDKVTVEVEAPGSGVLTGVTAWEGEEVPVGTVIARLVPAGTVEAAPAPVTAPAVPAPVSATPIAQRMAAEHGIDLSEIRVAGRRIEKRDVEAYLAQRKAAPAAPRLSPASPLARRLAQEMGLDVAQIDGSGPDGAVLAADVRAASEARVVVAPAVPEAAPYRVIPLTGARKVIAERTQRSFQTAPHIALTLSVDMSETMRLMEHLAEPIRQETGSELTLTAVLVQVTALALTRHPRLNAHLVDNEIREFDGVHLGIAVAVEDGLVVPVIRAAQTKGLAAIQTDLLDLARRARAGELTLQEIKGSTFTISNLGMYGIEQFTAIINPPEVGLLAVGTITRGQVEVAGQMTTRPLMKLTLMADHRAVDGAAGAQFLGTLRAMLENPYRLLT
jgi:pyruvate dehydrogenase E2 component (dihydrolipoamide acetyltransferase)